MPDSKLLFDILVWGLAAAFTAGVAITGLRFVQSKTGKDLNFVGGKVRTLEAARLEDRIDILLALYDAVPEDKRRDLLHDLLRPHGRR